MNKAQELRTKAEASKAGLIYIEFKRTMQELEDAADEGKFSIVTGPLYTENTDELKNQGFKLVNNFSTTTIYF